MTSAPQLELVSTVLLNAGFSWIIGALFAQWWLDKRQDEHVLEIRQMLRRSVKIAACVAFFSSIGILWASTAVMSDQSLWSARDMIWPMLSKTAYGQTGSVGLVCLFLIAALSFYRGAGRSATIHMTLFLAAFAVARASVSHAGEHGFLSIDLAIEWLHLVLIGLWVGGVAVAAWVVLPMTLKSQQHRSFGNYLSSLSHAATIALAGIVATGLYNAWQHVGSFDHLIGNDYGRTLIIKLILVALAIALGGYNKFIGFPSFTQAAKKSRAVAVLRIESALLLGVLFAAAVLTSLQPPAS